jgi:regulator of sigma E protease
VNIRVLELIQTGCAVLIIGYMLYVTFYDAQDLPFIRNKLDKMEQSAPAKPSPASTP